jgi:hypothetical protein
VNQTSSSGSLEVLELFAPGRAAVGAGEDLRVVADRRRACRRRRTPPSAVAGSAPGLGPGLALVVGIENVPAITHRHQALAGDNIEHQAFGALADSVEYTPSAGASAARTGADKAAQPSSVSAVASNAVLRNAGGRQRLIDLPLFIIIRPTGLEAPQVM